MDAFETRRRNDPQGLIDDLVGQTNRQSKALHDMREFVEMLKANALALGIPLPEEPVPKGRKKK